MTPNSMAKHFHTLPEQSTHYLFFIAGEKEKWSIGEHPSLIEKLWQVQLNKKEPKRFGSAFIHIFLY